MKTKFFLAAAYIFAAVNYCSAQESQAAKIFPIPQKMSFLPASFLLAEQSFIAVPENASEQDIFLARFLCQSLSDDYGFAVAIKRISKLKAGQKAIVMGSIHNPLVKAACKANLIEVTGKKPGPEGYVLRTDANGVLIAGSDDAGAFYGLQSLRQLITRNGRILTICGAEIEDKPYKHFRGIRLYMPGKDNIPFFKRFIRNFMAAYKFNTLILEVSTCMRYDRHPEINAGWIEFSKDMQYCRMSERPPGPRSEIQNSPDVDAGDGGIVEKADVADIVQYARQLHIDVIPDIPSLSHSYYLLMPHRELAEIPDARWPDTYCPSNPETYKLLFDVLDENIEVMKPKMVHIDHGEWWVPIDVCPRCKGRACAELYARDVNKIYDYLRKRKIEVGLWGDSLLEAANGKCGRTEVLSNGYSYRRAGALSPKEVKKSIPKDIVVFNWSWDDSAKAAGGMTQGEMNDRLIEEQGFRLVYGNLLPNIKNWAARSSRPNVLGGAPSSWAATAEFNFGKDLVYDFAGCANLLWSTHWPSQNDLKKKIQDMMPQIRASFKGTAEPSRDDNPVMPLDIGRYCNVAADEKIFDQSLSSMLHAQIKSGGRVFNMVDPNANGGKCAMMVGTEGENKSLLPREVNGIKIGRDVSSLIFLHACAKPARNEYSYRYLYNYPDTADLLGWYEVVYEDGIFVTIPVRYGWNILEWNPADAKCLYGADLVNCAKSGAEREINFYAFEWVNPRFGRKITRVNLKGSSEFRGFEQVIRENAIVAAAISAVPPRTSLPQ
jgi:hypothetical protein